MDLKQKHVVCVGAFGGIGFACCKCFLEHEVASLAVLDLAPDDEKLQELRSINAEAQVTFIQVDLGNKHNIDQAYAEAHQAMGHFDVVVNCSGITNEEQIERTIHVNLLGVIYSTYAALRYMDKSKGGNGGLILNVSSVAGLKPYGAYAVYTASKYGITGFTNAMADPVHYNASNVGFITLCPGYTKSGLTESLKINPNCTFGRLGEPPVKHTEQTAEECAMNIIKAAMYAKNGSTWILNAGNLTEYHATEL